MKKKTGIIVKIFIIILGLAAICMTYWHLYITGAFLPDWVEWKDEELIYSEDINISLKGREVSVFAGEDSTPRSVIWQSPDGTLVQDCLLADITGDGSRELVILCFRRAKYGPHMPFFVKKNEKNWSQHIDVYSYDESRASFRAIWMASDIGVDAKSWKYDKKHKRLLIQDKHDEVSSWLWPGFGFVRADDTVSFAVCGDNLIHDNIYEYGLEKRDGDFSFLYENITDRLQDFDVRVLNLETILVDEPELYGGYPAFGTPIQVGVAAKNAGFQIFTCATNHAFDKGMAGVDTTAGFCNMNDITYLGITSSEEKEEVPYKVFWKKGYSFALFNYTMGLSNTQGKSAEDIASGIVSILTDEEYVREKLTEAGEEADAVIVFVHWGTENTAAVDEFQKKWAAVFNECGVDVVVGTHPHVLQPVEVLTNDSGKETLVYYSLGNLISAQRQEENKIGGIAEFEMRVSMEGMKIDNYKLEKTLTFKENQGYSVKISNEKVGE